ncbi:MAG: hypothetical protein H0T05_00855 [Acidobacteria bacterium]|nr:hypothetical protein [Acidobacteriota bacterium]
MAVAIAACSFISSPSAARLRSTATLAPSAASASNCAAACENIVQRIRRAPAPSASRMPISRRRWVTENAIIA